MSDFLIEQRCAEALAREAGHRIERARAQGFAVDYKGANDVVTEIDVAIERFLTEQLGALFPDDRILGEELDHEEAPAEGRTWVLDPIDGTLNFSRGIPIYCVSIALQVDRQSVVGVIYDPSRGELFSARRGHGATLDGEPMEVTDREALSETVLVTGFPPSRHEDNLPRFAALTRATHGIRRLGSAALDLAYVAAGRLDGFWEFHLNPWDTAAGYLLVQEAGGQVTDVDGGHYTGFEPSILATNGAVHAELAAALQEAA